ncbi:hypothetical protein BDR04DRAFT_980957, partial [Suillus decipiens]
DLMVRWIPGHKGVKGNELADEEAKKAAEGSKRSSPKEPLPPSPRIEKLPDSISALKQWHQTDLNPRWSEQWKKSPRYAKAMTIDASMPSKRY